MKADTWIEILAECPHCGDVHPVDLVFDSDSESRKWTCTTCEKDFEYWHPDNGRGNA